MRNDTSVGGTNCSAVTVTKRSKGQKDPILSPFLETSGPPPFILHPLHSDFDGKLFSQGSHKLSTNTSFLHDTKHSLHQENFNQGTPQTLSQLERKRGQTTNQAPGREVEANLEDASCAQDTFGDGRPVAHPWRPSNHDEHRYSPDLHHDTDDFSRTPLNPDRLRCSGRRRCCFHLQYHQQSLKLPGRRHQEAFRMEAP